MAQYAFSPINFPGAKDTSASDINNSGEIVGSYFGNVSGGFAYDGQNFTSYDFPSSRGSSVLSSASDNGDFLGFALSNNDYRSFVYENGIYSPLPGPPGSEAVFANRFGPSGQEIVGSYREGRYIFGFTYTNGNLTTVVHPQAFRETELNGVNAAGAIVGQYDLSYGFLDVGGVFSSIAYPGATSTNPMDINDTGEIVGTFTDAAGNMHGFTDVAGIFNQIDVPGSANTTVNGVNDAGELVGSYDTSSSTYGAFVATPAVCFCEGARIRVVRHGEEIDVAVETLLTGDLVVTTSGLARPIRWIGHRSMDSARHSRPDDIWPICIAAGALGVDGGGRIRPSLDLWVSPGHGVCFDVQGEILVPASALVDGRLIRRERLAIVTYWHVELDRHDIILAENTPCESYLDMGNRDFFAEEAVVQLTASPDGIMRRPTSTHADFCRPFHAAGPMVAAIRARLAAVPEIVGEAYASRAVNVDR